MRKVVLALGLIALVGLSTGPESRAEGVPTWTGVFAEDLLSLPDLAYAADSCGDEGGCLSASKHKLKDGDEYSGTHSCQTPESHSGVGCLTQTLALPEVRSMTLDEVQDYVASVIDANVAIRSDMEVIDVLSCDRSAIIGRVPFSHLRAE